MGEGRWGEHKWKILALKGGWGGTRTKFILYTFVSETRQRRNDDVVLLAGCLLLPPLLIVFSNSPPVPSSAIVLELGFSLSPLPHYGAGSFWEDWMFQSASPADAHSNWRIVFVTFVVIFV